MEHTTINIEREHLLREPARPIKSPFLDVVIEVENPIYKWFKYILVGIVLLPLRAIFALLSLILLTLLFKIATLGLDRSDINTPLPYWRRLFLIPVWLLGRLLLFAWGFMWIKRTGDKIMDTTIAPIIVSNHVSFMDPMILAIEYIPTVVSEAENLAFPFIGSMMLATKAILIDREDKNSRQNAKQDIINRARASYKDSNWFPILMFPEGTCTNGHCVVKFKVGAFSAGLPVQPVCIKYPYQYFNLSWTKEPTPIHFRMLRMFFQFFNWVEMIYLPVYIPSQEEIDDPILYCENVEKLIARTLNVPVCNNSYEDSLLIIKCGKLKADYDYVTDVSFLELSAIYRIDIKQIENFLTRFVEIDRNSRRDFHINYLEFSSFFDLPDSVHLQTIFSSFEKKNPGYITFKEFVTGYCQVARKNEKEDKFELVYQLFDEEKSGRVNRRQFNKIKRQIYGEFTDQQLDRLFDSIDDKNEGFITFESFSKFAKSNQIYYNDLVRTSGKWTDLTI